MNRWERRGEKARKKCRDRGGERHEYEVLALLWQLTVHAHMNGHKQNVILPFDFTLKIN